MVFAIHNWPDGASYEGQWANDLSSGKGVYSTTEGLIYNKRKEILIIINEGCSRKLIVLFIIINSWIPIFNIFNFNIQIMSNK